MKASDRGRVLVLGLVLAAFSFAPGPEVKAKKPSALAEARYKAAKAQFEEVWTYYRQSRTDSFLTYYWSRMVLEAQQDLCTNKDERIAALVAHQERMQQLQTLVHKVRRLGFSYSTDVKATDYYKVEVERLLEKANAE